MLRPDALINREPNVIVSSHSLDFHILIRADWHMLDSSSSSSSRTPLNTDATHSDVAEGSISFLHGAETPVLAHACYFYFFFFWKQ